MSRTPDPNPPPDPEGPKAAPSSDAMVPEDDPPARRGPVSAAFWEDLNSGPPVGRRSKVAWLIAAIAAVSALWLARQNLALNAELDNQNLATDNTQLQLRALRQRLEAEQLIGQGEITRLRQAQIFADPARLQVTFLTPPPGALGGTGEVRAFGLWNPSTTLGVLVVTGLAPAGSDGDYQLWLLPAPAPAAKAGGPTEPPVDAGVFTVDPATGEARRPFKVTGRPPARFTVTRERHGGAPQPTGPVVLAGP